MISITKADVPLYLREGALFRALEDSADQFSIPVNNFKADVTLTTSKDLSLLLSSLQYWAVDKLPIQTILPYLLQEDDQLEDVSKHFMVFPPLEFLVGLKDLPDDAKIAKSISFGCIEAVRYLDEQDYPWPEHACGMAATNGPLEMLEYIFQRNGTLSTNTAREAAAWGHADCLQYAVEHGGCEEPSHLAYTAAEHGRLDCLKYLHGANLLSINGSMTNYAADSGSVECVAYLRGLGCICDRLTTNSAAEHGHLPLLQYLSEIGCEGNTVTMCKAAERGHMHCVQYLHEQGCPWNEYSCHAAASNGHIAVLEYLHTHGCPWDENTVLFALPKYSCSCLTREVFVCLMYMHEHDDAIDKEKCLEAAIPLHRMLSSRADSADLLLRCEEYIVYLQESLLEKEKKKSAT